MPEVPYQYFMTVSPLDGFLYISDQHARQIVRVRTMGSVRNLGTNSLTVAGTSEQCYPTDAARCGDGLPAESAKLFHPKGTDCRPQAPSSSILKVQTASHKRQALNPKGSVENQAGTMDTHTYE